MLAVLLGAAGGGLVFFLLCLVVKGVTSGRIPALPLMGFILTPLAVLLVAAFADRAHILACGTAMVATMLICVAARFVISHIKAGKDKRR